MNRIILVGNGFDLAHGLKTSYRDFIDDFWNKVKKGFYPLLRYDGEAIEIYGSSSFPHPPENGCDWYKALVNINKSHHDVVRIKHKNNFLKRISESFLLKNWVDIEEEYYLALNECLNDKWKGGIDALNKDFFAIQEALKKYLITQPQNVTSESIRFANNLYSESIKYGFNQFPETTSKHILFLNFNYTKINSYYCQYSNFDSRVFIHIHGELDNPNNPIILGYGDEIGDMYKHIEDKNDNRYLEYIKSVKYLETSNYKKLLTFMESEKYEIFIVGHSCGISDKTLLNTLFEHENCESIKIFYHKRTDGTDNFGDLSRNVSRVFTNKALMRRRVISKEDSQPL